MKKSIVKISLMALSCVATLIFTSCISSDDDNTRYYQGYYTITGTYPNYKLIEDGGSIVYPTVASVNKVTESKGFGDNKRAIIAISYDENFLTTNSDGISVVRNAEIQSGNYLVNVTPISLAAAQDKNIIATDSVFSIGAFTNYWVSNGYLTTIFTAPVSYAPDYLTTGQLINPTVNLCINPTDITENNVTLNLLYNRHTKKDAMSTNVPNLIYTFDIANINIPGSDTVNVTLKAEGTKEIKLKIPRRSFVHPQ